MKLPIRSSIAPFPPNGCLVSSTLRASVIFCLALAAPLWAQSTNSPAGSIKQIAARGQTEQMIKGGYLYAVDFPGGSLAAFAQFWRTNGFPNDTMLMVGRGDQVVLPKFTITSARLKEVAKSIEFVSQGQLQVEVVEKEDANGANLWRISALNDGQAGAVKVRACPVVHLLARKDGSREINNLLNLTRQMFFQNRARIGPRYEGGQAQLLEANRLVVAMGPEDFVEAIANVVAAAEQSAATQLPPRW